MDIEQLELIIKEGEGLTVEFKERYTSKIDRDIVAFANSRGGLLLLGVDDHGKMVGENLTNKLKAEINALARNCDPQIHIKSIKQIGRVVLVEIPPGEDKPYSSSSGYYRRLDAVTQKMTQKEVGVIFRDNNNFYFESLPCADMSIQDISLAKTKTFLKETSTSYKANKANLPLVLSSLRAIDQGVINNAGAMMFSANIGLKIPHAECILAAFKGADRVHIYDRKDMRDDLLTQFNEAIAFLIKHLNVRSEIRGVNRHDIYELPLDALREAVVNAIIHRDYAFRGTSIYVMVFDDRVEIESPGGLPFGITQQTFGKASIRRNPIIADLFHRMGKVECMGSGIKRMRELMLRAGLKKPVFEVDSFFRAIFYRDSKYSLKGGDLRLVDRLVDRLAESQRKILSLISKNPYISKQELSKEIAISTTAIDKNIRTLKQKGLLKRMGSAKGGHWEISKKT